MTAYEMRISDRSSDVCSSDLPVLLRQLTDQPVEADRPAPLVRAVPRVDVLAEQRDLARPARDQRPRLGNQIGEGPARIGAARIGDDAIGAELAAAFLHGQEGGGAVAAVAFRQRDELAFERHVEVDTLGRASWRERVCADGQISGKAG